MYKKLFLFSAMLVLAFIACNTAAAASHTVVWQDNRDGCKYHHIYYRNSAWNRR